MLNCNACGFPLEKLEFEYDGKPIHQMCLDYSILKTVYGSLNLIPFDLPEWLKEFARNFKGWTHYHYG